MLRLADVAARHGPAYVARHRGAMLPSHVRALSAITLCRTPSLGAHLGVCAHCARRHLLYHSCRHRACARCGRDATDRWLARQRQLLLPVRYFHVVFLRQLQLLLGAAADRDLDAPEPPRRPPRRPCPHCRGGELILMRRLSPDECRDFLAATAAARAPPRTEPLPREGLLA